MARSQPRVMPILQLSSVAGSATRTAGPSGSPGPLHVWTVCVPKLCGFPLQLLRPWAACPHISTGAGAAAISTCLSVPLPGLC